MKPIPLRYLAGVIVLPLFKSSAISACDYANNTYNCAGKRSAKLGSGNGDNNQTVIMPSGQGLTDGTAMPKTS
ncbi:MULTISPECIES: hypothetical protein [Ochrobactrum]|uniref:DUF680 domain-containing protein n=1 Tax=Ochrobactrum chromiisoli TaxID=2993941 RepID=A0ABT3QUX8_9HYPH|nr:hypothetical protein [Ochrobactrum chromiisoli]MCH4543915.1 hypothetical protein [Ochrobactrum sp. A-1]MCX2699433.1 hypothetical protein [Ochrobactrum chromiisoli]